MGVFLYFRTKIGFHSEPVNAKFNMITGVRTANYNVITRERTKKSNVITRERTYAKEAYFKNDARAIEAILAAFVHVN